MNRLARFIGVRWESGLTVAIVCFGVALRVRQWAHSRSMWLDEASLALSFDRFDLSQIVTQRLVSNQSAPPGFLVFTELSVHLFGRSERSLRLVALIAGIASLVVAVVVARRLLTHAFSRIVFIASMALSPPLVYYSNEVKQYSLDVLAILVVLWLWSERDSHRRMVIAAVSGFIVSLFSLMGIVGLFSLGLALVTEKRWARRRGGVPEPDPGQEAPPPRPACRWVVFGVWAVGIALHALYTLFAGVDREWMRQWWVQNGGFPPRSISELDWYPLSVSRLLWIGVSDRGRVGAIADTGFLPLVGIMLVFAVLAIWRRRDLRHLLIPLFLVVWFLAETRLYPTSGRLSLYLVPVVFLVVAAGFETVFSKTGTLPKVLSLGAVGCLLFQQLSISGPLLVEPFGDSDMQWISQQLAVHSRRSDDIINSPAANPGIWYGLPEFVEPSNYSTVRSDSDLPSRITEGVAERIWVVSTHRVRIAMDLVDSLSRFGYQKVCVVLSSNTYLALLIRWNPLNDFDPGRECPTSDSR